MKTYWSTSKSSRQVVIDNRYEHSFPRAEFSNYDAFLAAAGEVFKSEFRTKIVIIRRSTDKADGGTPHSFVLKIYYYPPIPGIRTGLQRSKAEREFYGLRFLAGHGVPTVEPVAFGVERTRLGFVRSCFVVTRLLDDSVNLAQWRSESLERSAGSDPEMQVVLKQLGSIFRRFHQENFFLFTAKPKNILIRSQSIGSPEIFLVDVPYCRTLRPSVLARWGQRRDLGMFFANFRPSLSESDIAAFYDGYLPDPLGSSEAALYAQVHRAVRSKHHETPISALLHQLNLALKSKMLLLAPMLADTLLDCLSDWLIPG